jgi:uncharacterized protein
MQPMRHLAAVGFALLFMLAALAAPARADPSFPPLTGRVVDAANVLPPEVEARLTQKLSGLQIQSGRQLVVATLPDLQGYDIADYGYQLGRAWEIGAKGKNDGAILIVAPKERKLRIEVGYGLEGTLTDGLSSLIISQQIVPRFKDGDIPGGVEAGTDEIIRVLTLPPEEAAKLAAEASKAPDEGGFDWFTLIFIAFIFLFFILPLFRRMRGGRRYSSGGFVPVVWDSGGSSSSSDWSSSSSSSSDSFSGGGGDFGGGGSSGDW